MLLQAKFCNNAISILVGTNVMRYKCKCLFVMTTPQEGCVLARANMGHSTLAKCTSLFHCPSPRSPIHREKARIEKMPAEWE